MSKRQAMLIYWFCSFILLIIPYGIISAIDQYQEDAIQKSAKCTLPEKIKWSELHIHWNNVRREYECFYFRGGRLVESTGGAR